MQKKGTFSAYLVIVASILLTKLLGLARTIFLGAFYGTGMEAGAFIAVSKLPLTLYDVTLGTAIVSAFIPVFNERLTAGGKKDANRFGSNFLTLALVLSAMLSALCFCFPAFTVKLFAPGFEGEQLALATKMMQIIIPIILFATASFILIGILQSYGEFTVPALVSLFSNLSIILYFLLLNDRFGIIGLSVAFTVGWSLQLLFLIPFAIKQGFRYTPRLSWGDADIKKVLILTLPLFVSSLAQPINTLISTNLSSSLGDGSGVAVLGYAYDAYFIVAAVFSSAMTNLFFPELSRRFSANDMNGAADIGASMLKTVSAIILPVMGLVMVLGEPIISLLLERGEFTAQNTLQVALCLCIYCIGMISLSFQEILNKFFYAMQNSVIPMLAAMGGITLNILSAFLLSKVFGFYGLAAATVLSGYAMALFLLLVARKKVSSLVTSSFWISIGKSTLSAAVAAAGAWGVKVLLSALQLPSFLQNCIILACALLVGAAVYLGMLWICRSEEINALLSLVKKKGGKADA